MMAKMANVLEDMEKDMKGMKNKERFRIKLES